MRVRVGFVSNSSSSSFILASDKPLDELTVTFTFKLKPVVEETLRTQDDVYRYAFDRWAWSGKTLEESLREEPYGKPMYEEMLRAIEEGKSVLVGTCSNEGCEIAEQVLFAKGFSEMDESVAVIEGINW